MTSRPAQPLPSGVLAGYFAEHLIGYTRVGSKLHLRNDAIKRPAKSLCGLRLVTVFVPTRDIAEMDICGRCLQCR